MKVLNIEWIATGDPNVIAASGYPIQIERKPATGKFVVSGYGKTDQTDTLYFAQWIAHSWVKDQAAFNKIAGVQD